MNIFNILFRFIIPNIKIDCYKTASCNNIQSIKNILTYFTHYILLHSIWKPIRFMSQ